MSHLSQVVQTLPSDPSLNKIGPTICGYSSGCRLWASISRSFDHRRAQSECICKCVQIRFILTYGCKWVFSLVFTATSTVWLKNLYLNMLSWYDVRFNSKLTTGHFFVDHFVNTSSEESTRVSTLELFYSGNVICFLWFGHGLHVQSFRIEMRTSKCPKANCHVCDRGNISWRV